MKELFTILILAGVYSCSATAEGNIKITNSGLEKVIKGYINTVFKYDNRNAITVQFYRSSFDTVNIRIVDAFPDIKVSKYMGYQMLDKYRICFTSEDSIYGFFEVKGKSNIPQDIVSANENPGAHQDVLSQREPYVQEFWSIDGRQILPKGR